MRYPKVDTDLTPREALDSLTSRGVDRDTAVQAMRHAWLKGPQRLAVPGGLAEIRWSAWRFTVGTTKPSAPAGGRAVTGRIQAHELGEHAGARDSYCGRC